MTTIERDQPGGQGVVDPTPQEAEALLREAHRRRRRRRVLTTTAVVASVACACGIAIAGNSGPPSPTARQATPTSSPPPTATPTPAVVPPCTSSALYSAAATAEHFSVRSAGYGAKWGYPGVGYMACAGSWAIGYVSRPYVNITDGETLFRVERGRWAEVAIIGWPVCAGRIQRSYGVPARVIRILVPENGGSCVTTKGA